MHIFFEKTTKFLSFLFTLFSLMLNNNNWLSIHISIVSLVSSSLIAIVVSNVLDNVRTTIGSDVRERAAHCNRLIRFTLTQNLAGHVVFDAVRQLPTANQTNQISKNYKKKCVCSAKLPVMPWIDSIIDILVLQNACGCIILGTWPCSHQCNDNRQNNE